MKKLLSTVAMASMLAMGLSTVGTAPAHADGADAYGKPCNPKKYRDHYEVTNRTIKPEVTYEVSSQLGPHEQWKTTEEIVLKKQLAVNAKITAGYKAGGSVSLPGKLLGELHAETNLSFEAGGSANREKTVRTHEERSFGNPDNRNRKLIFYRGVTKATGKFTYFACKQHYLPGQSYGPFEVHIYYGKFETWTDHVKLSHLLCGRASTGALAHMVAQKYCPL